MSKDHTAAEAARARAKALNPWVVITGRGRPARNGFNSDGSVERYELFATSALAWAALDPTYGRRARLYWISNGYGVRRATWREREEIRLESGTYAKLVWTRESFWLNSYAEARYLHYAHASDDDPGSVAFTESEAKGEADRQTRMKAGRYLKKFFGDDLSDKQIAYYAEWQQSGCKPPIDWITRSELHFASSPEAITETYDKGPNSCMQGSACVRVYGAGDLAVAYLRRPDAPGAAGPQIVARALVWPEKKALGRIYPNTESWRGDGFNSCEESEACRLELQARLRADGYVSFYEDSYVFDGARILAEREREGSSSFIMPYIDKLATSGPYKGADGREYFTLSASRDFQPDRTDGRWTVEDQPACDRCDDEYDADDGGTVWREWLEGSQIDAGQWCESCRNNHTFYCDATGVSYDDDVDTPVDVRVSQFRSETWNSAYADANAFDFEGDWIARSLESERFPGFPRWLDDDADAHPELETETLESSEREHGEIAF